MLHDIDMSKMAPCPFCGQQGDYYIKDVTEYHMVFYSEYWDLEADEYQYSVECAECNATVYGNLSDNEQEAYDSAISSWNHRV